MENFSFNLLFSFTKSTPIHGKYGSINKAVLIEYKFRRYRHQVYTLKLLLLQNSFMKFGNGMIFTHFRSKLNY